MARERIDIVCK